MLRPSPLDISGLFSGTFQALKQRFGLFVLIALLPFVAAVVLVGAGVAIVVACRRRRVRLERSAGGAVPIGILVGAALIGRRRHRDGARPAEEPGHDGRRPPTRSPRATRPDLARPACQRTRGFLPRMAPVIAIAVGALVVVYGAIIALGSRRSAVTAARRRHGAAGAAAVGLLRDLRSSLCCCVPLGIFVQTKLLYTIPAVAIEQRRWHRRA